MAELIRSRALLIKVKVPRQLPELDKTFQVQLTEIGKRLNALTKQANTQMKADLALTLDMGEVHSLLDQLGEIQKQIQEVVSSRSPQSLTISAKRDPAPLVHTRSIRLAPDEYEWQLWSDSWRKSLTWSRQLAVMSGLLLKSLNKELKRLLASAVPRQGNRNTIIAVNLP